MATDAIVKTIERQDWLQPAEDALKSGLDGAFALDTAHGKPVENALHGMYYGHALHPALVTVPLGAWTVSLVLDLIEETTGERRYRPGADAALTLGLAGALGAAATGITDWKEVGDDSRRIGLVHGLLNVVSTGLFAASVIQRSRKRLSRKQRAVARTLAYCGYGIGLASAWLGGHMVYANRAAVARLNPATPPDKFVSVLSVADLEENKPHQVEAGGYPVVLVKQAGKVYALAHECNHLGGPLAEGTVEGDCIRCPWHGSLFRLSDGAVKESPAVRPQITFDVRVRNGEIQVRVRTQESRGR